MNKTINYEWVKRLIPNNKPWVQVLLAKEMDRRDQKIKKLEEERAALYDKFVDLLRGSE